MFGYTGKVLRVDLTRQAYTIEEPGETFYRTYGGGRGLIAQWLLREVPAGADPLGPENVLIFATGPTTGLPVSGSARHSVGAKSPLTGGYGDAEAGGYWGHEFKCAGWDALIVTGQAAHPVYLWIADGAVEFRSAEALWGERVLETEERIRAELAEPRARIAAIGPAGEKLARIACILHDCRHAAGRTGLGAVMGAKRLKAIAVRGTQHVAPADEARVRELARWVAGNIPAVAGWLMGGGTGQHLDASMASGNLPVRNYQGGSFPHAHNISTEAMQEQGLIPRMEGCFACALRCKKAFRADTAFMHQAGYGGPEYETIAALGSNCGVDDLATVCRAHEICNANGLDTISAGGAIAWAIECAERGILRPDECDGLALRWGNGEAVLALLEKMVRREGLGDLLADGASHAAARIGRGSERLAMDVKGQAVAMHEPRLKNALGLGYAVSPTGADHSHNVHDVFYESEGGGLDSIKPLGILEPLPARELGPAKVRLFTYVHLWRHLYNVLDICSFVGWPLDRLAALVSAATGWETGTFELLKIAERAVNLARVFNLREGLTAADDRLPERFFQPLAEGPLSDHGIDAADFAQALPLYYRMMGWDATTGAPTRAKLIELGISWAAEHLPG